MCGACNEILVQDDWDFGVIELQAEEEERHARFVNGSCWAANPDAFRDLAIRDDQQQIRILHQNPDASYVPEPPEALGTPKSLPPAPPPSRRTVKPEPPIEIDERKWVTLPALRTGPKELSVQASAVLRHDRIERDPEGMILWETFLDRWAYRCDTAAPCERIARWETPADALWDLIRCCNKPRFRVFWNEPEASTIGEIQIKSNRWWDKFVPPVGIKAIQGHSRDVIHDERAIAVPPNFVENLYHASYRHAMASVIANGLYPGGLQGASHRSQVFFSMTDWTTYASGYRPADVTFDRCLREPYFPRASNDIQVVVTLKLLHKFNLEPAQTESLAVVTRANSRVPSERIQYISSLRTNEILWRREPTLSASYGS
jgi:hypothetical protein